jgi:hypothetical protein
MHESRRSHRSSDRPGRVHPLRKEGGSHAVVFRKSERCRISSGNKACPCGLKCARFTRRDPRGALWARSPGGSEGPEDQKIGRSGGNGAGKTIKCPDCPARPVANQDILHALAGGKARARRRKKDHEALDCINGGCGVPRWRPSPGGRQVMWETWRQQGGQPPGAADVGRWLWSGRKGRLPRPGSGWWQCDDKGRLL